ncbi:MAG: hypothetical protein GF331_21465, partial [Chitinivibrionales bacterium]|nr:hypothetical protein [Chitinivibrionales bacterium]
MPLLLLLAWGDMWAQESRSRLIEEILQRNPLLLSQTPAGSLNADSLMRAARGDTANEMGIDSLGSDSDSVAVVVPEPQESVYE